MKVKESAVDKTVHVTIDDVVTFSGKDRGFVTKALKAFSVEPVGSIDTGQKGRPPRLFLRTAVVAALESAERELLAARAATAQTNSEATTTKVA